MSTQVDFAGLSWTLLPERAIFCEQSRTLLVADLHLGKAAAFRAAGIPVPSGATAKDLDRLTLLIQKTAAARLIILGDFFHAKAGRSDNVLDAIATWRRIHAATPMLLVRGNHDRSAGRVAPEWGIEEIDGQLEDNGVLLSHAPIEDADKPVLAGHVHPVFALRDYDGAAVKAPCFVFDPRCAILPSFGTFTGGHTIRNIPPRRIFIIAGQRIIPVGIARA